MPACVSWRCWGEGQEADGLLAGVSFSIVGACQAMHHSHSLMQQAEAVPLLGDSQTSVGGLLCCLSFCHPEPILHCALLQQAERAVLLGGNRMSVEGPPAHYPGTVQPL